MYFSAKFLDSDCESPLCEVGKSGACQARPISKIIKNHSVFHSLPEALKGMIEMIGFAQPFFL